MGQDCLVSTARSLENGCSWCPWAHLADRKSSVLSLDPSPHCLGLDSSLDHDSPVSGLEDSNPSPDGHQRHSFRHWHGFFRRIRVKTQVFMMCSGRNQMLRNVQALLEFAEGTLENRKLKHIPSGFAKWWIYNGESIINVQQIQASNKDSNLGAPTRHGSFSPLVKSRFPTCRSLPPKFTLSQVVRGVNP